MNNPYEETKAEVGTNIDDTWLEVYVNKLEALSVYAAFSWGWSVLMANDPSFANLIHARSRAAFLSKPFGCEQCEEKVATKYHVYIGRVCSDCFDTLPQE